MPGIASRSTQSVFHSSAVGNSSTRLRVGVRTDARSLVSGSIGNGYKPLFRQPLFRQYSHFINHNLVVTAVVGKVRGYVAYVGPILFSERHVRTLTYSILAYVNKNTIRAWLTLIRRQRMNSLETADFNSDC